MDAHLWEGSGGNGTFKPHVVASACSPGLCTRRRREIERVYSASVRLLMVGRATL